METLVKRSDKVAFYGVPGENSVTYTRMKGFTELSTSKNAGEYSRQYVDEDTERTDVVRYSPTTSFAFDEYTGDEVLTDIVDIIDNEKLGTDAQREIIQVDFSKPVNGGGYAAIKRTVTVIADSEGDSMDAYTYSGSFSAVGSFVTGTAAVSTPTGGTKKTAETITFTADTAGE